VRLLGLMLSLGLQAACGAAVVRPETPPGPGVPRIANLRFDPEAVRIGETLQMSFYFEVGTADLDEGFLIQRGIREFQFYQDLQPTPIDLRRYHGQVAGTIEVPLRWSTEGVLFLEVYVVSKQGNASNRLNGRVTVR
jgi:hypothetical protein